MENEHINKSYYAIIPANVRYDKNLKDKAKLLYGEITALCNEKGYCWAGNKYFAELYGVTAQTISYLIKNLIDEGYITTELIYKEGTKEILNRYIKILGEGIKEIHNTPIKENFKDNNTVINNTFNNYSSSLYTKIENEFCRTLSPSEIELIQEWINNYENEVIELAIKEACLRNTKNLKYVNGILKNWKGKSLDEIKQPIPKKKEHTKIFDYDWLEDDE